MLRGGGLRALIQKNVRNTGTRKEKERKTENHMERLVKKKYGKCGINGGGRTGQDQN